MSIAIRVKNPLSLPLLVLGVFCANYPDDAFAPDDLAPIA
jgi:hypothetical protein